MIVENYKRFGVQVANLNDAEGANLELEGDKVLKRIGKNGKIGGLDMFSSSDIGKKSFTIEFYNSFEKIYKQNFTSKFGVEKIQLSIIKEGSVIDVSPFLKLK